MLNYMSWELIFFNIIPKELHVYRNRFIYAHSTPIGSHVFYIILFYKHVMLSVSDVTLPMLK
jgi:hypothetical protein